MATLLSGLPEIIADDETVSRFLTQSNHFNSVMAKGVAFLPNPKHRNTSVFRIGNEREVLLQTWKASTNGERSLKAVALVISLDVRNVGLNITAKEPPAAHANIEGWPWLENDPDLQKARQKDMANQIASKTSVVIF